MIKIPALLSFVSAAHPVNAIFSIFTESKITGSDSKTQLPFSSLKSALPLF